jgi:hypothetical protein
MSTGPRYVVINSLFLFFFSSSFLFSSSFSIHSWSNAPSFLHRVHWPQFIPSGHDPHLASSWVYML